MQPDNLISLKDDMVAFIAGHGMRRLNGYVSDDVPAVLFEEEDADGWKDFVEHAKAAGAPFVIMSEVVLEKADIVSLLEQSFPDSDSPEVEEVQSLVQYVGKTGYLQLGFAHQGVMFLYETATEWYDRFQQLMESMADLGGLIVDDGDNDD
jgi:ABC-type sugar transport system substrate-binding protein